MGQLVATNGKSTKIKNISKLEEQSLVLAAEARQKTEEFKRLFAEAATSYWKAGELLHEIHDRKLWNALREPGGKPLYSSFEQYMKSEFDLGKTYSHQMINVWKTYTREEVEQFGVSKLAMLLKVSIEEREEIKSKLPQLSSRDVKTKVSPKKAPAVAVGKVEFEAELLESETKTPLAKQTIIPFEVFNNIKLKIYEKPDDAMKEIHQCKQAKDLNNGAWGYLDLNNEIELGFEIFREKKDKNHLYLRLAAKPIEEDEA